MAEFQIYADSIIQSGDYPVIASRKERKEEIRNRNLSDGKILTNMFITDWAGLDLGESRHIDSMRLLTYHDDNNVVPGEIYELFYWDGPQAVSLGRVTAADYTLRYDSVPGETLYLLRNRTKGREERIFTYENDRIVFW